MKKLEKLPRCLILALLIFLLLTFAASAQTGKVNAQNGLNMRSEASTGASVVMIISNGVQLDILETLPDWYKVSYLGKTGYVSKTYIDLPAPVFAVVNAKDGLNLRQSPSTSASKVAVLPNGAQVTILETLPDWYRVSYSDKTGYVSKDYIVLTGDSSLPEYATVISTYGLNLRSGPSTDYQRLEIIPYGARIEVASRYNDEWCEVKYMGKSGFVTDQYLRFGSTSLLSRGDTDRGSTGAQELLAFSKNYIGYKYAYGGQSPSTGFDCSGFVYFVFKEFGYTLPRTATSQSQKGESVKKSDLIPGDLVFFTSPGYSSKITHVGIYVGSGDFIHATSPGDVVRIETLESGYYYRNYICATRIL